MKSILVSFVRYIRKTSNTVLLEYIICVFIVLIVAASLLDYFSVINIGINNCDLPIRNIFCHI